MAEKNSSKYPEFKNCVYDGEGTCAAIGCFAHAMLTNIKDAKGEPNYRERAQKIIDDAKSDGCPNTLSIP